MPLRRRARRLCNAFGIRPQANEKPAAHLEWADPQLENLRAYVKSSAASQHIHPRLIANFDQVWSLNFRPSKTSLQKKASFATDDLMKSKVLRQVRHNVERALDMQITEPDPATQRKEVPAIPQVQGGKAANATVQNWRQPRTLTTLSFIDGHIGRGYVTLKENTISQQSLAKMNHELGRYLFIAPPQKTTHIWNEESLIPYLSFLAEEIRSRRRELGLDATSRAMVLMDQAGAHMSQTYWSIQKKWCDEHNVETR